VQNPRHRPPTLLIAALGATASALPSTLSRRACTLVKADDLTFEASKTAGVSYPQTLNFNIGPVTAGPCSLLAKFSPGFPITQTGTAQMEVINAGSQVGTIGPIPTTGQYSTINSFICKDVLTFDFQIASWGQDGRVAFTGTDGAGFFVQVGDC